MTLHKPDWQDWLRERTNCGRGCSFSFFIDMSLYDKTIGEDMDLVKSADKNVP